MAIFGPNEAELGGGQQASPFTPRRPVADEATAGLVDTASTFISGGMAALGGQRQQRREQAFEQQQAEQKANATTGFQTELTRLNRAVEQGRMDSASARSRASVILNQYSDAYPALSSDFRKIVSDVEGSAIMGESLTDGTPEEQAIQDIWGRAVENFYVDPTAPQEEQDAGMISFVNAMREKNRLDNIQQEINISNARTSGEAARFNLQQNRLNVEAQEAATNYALNSGEQIRTQALGVARQFESGEITQEEADRLLDQMETNFLNTLEGEVGTRLDSTYLGNLSGLGTRAVENAREVVSGNRQATWLETQNRSALAEATSTWYQNPRLARIAAGSRLFQNSPELQRMISVGISEEVGNVIEGFSDPEQSYNPFPRHDQGKEGFTAYVDNMITPNLRLAGRGQLDEESSEELGRHIEGFMNGISDYAGTTQSILDFKPVVDMLSSDDFGRYVEQAGGIPGEGVADRVQSALGRNYTDEVVPMIRERFEQEMVTFSNTSPQELRRSGLRPSEGRRESAPANRLIDREFNGSSFRFKPASSMLSPSQMREARNLADKLNESVSPVMNRIVKMGAHLEGHREYRRIYEQIADEVFSDPFAEQEEEDAQSSED